MLDLNDNIESPFILKVSFNTFLNHYVDLAKNKNELISSKAKYILKIQESIPEFKEGFSDISLLKKYQKEINIILQDAFSEVLTNNEIKTASIPFHNIIFNSSKRFEKIIQDAGKGFEIKIFNMADHDRYIIACILILNTCYGYNINLKRPIFYEIPNSQGILKYYKALYNIDFMEIIPLDTAKGITKQDIDELLDNYDNLELWKEKFPPKSYLFKGFVISNIFDVTGDQAISNIKTNLIGKGNRTDNKTPEEFHRIFQSLFDIKEINVGISIYNKEDKTFSRTSGESINSFLLHKVNEINCEECLCNSTYTTLLEQNKYVTISDVNKEYEIYGDRKTHIKNLKDQGIGSAILAPIANEKGLMGVLELVSKDSKKLNSINANKIIDIMPHIISSVERSIEEEQNLIEVVIQKECTSIHSSVYWKFKKEAQRFINEEAIGNPVSFQEIKFKDVYPLYGQIDIKGSSEARNTATQKDLLLQLNSVKNILEKKLLKELLPIYKQYLYQVETFINDLKNNFQVDSEKQISYFFKNRIEPLFNHFKTSKNKNEDIIHYFETINKSTGIIYKHRKNFDDTITLINKKMASLLDKKQVEAQKMYPHFFERYKTDGVEHNMYIGESITKENSFDTLYLYNLRLWQLQVMCEMENSFYLMQPNFPVNLDVTSMILVFNTPLSISFRMDEKKFDVEGTYNARYEIIKKRVDKAYIKGTQERFTQKGKISIVYSQKEDELEYLKYIQFLQSQHYLDNDVEILELEDLQAVTGLKAIRVSILYSKTKKNPIYYTYNDLVNVIK